MLQFLKNVLKRILARFGFQMVRNSAIRYSFARALKQVTNTGFEPRTVIDVGVAYGTPELYAAFPDARLMLVEALKEWEPTLTRLRAERDAEYVIAAAGPAEGTVDISVPEVLAWASIDASVDGHGVPDVLAWYSTDDRRGEVEWRTIPMVTLDSLRASWELEPPFVLKIDVEGAEAGVLEGARGLLGECEIVACEMTLDVNYWGVHNLLEEFGFVLHDVYGQHYRPSDGALVQIDMMFVKADGILRRGPYYRADQQGAVDSMADSLAALNPPA